MLRTMRWMRNTPPPIVAQGQRAIGMFDSGVGGLSILREIRRILPKEAIVYVADQDAAPYGERSLEEVRDRAVSITGMLLGRGAKAIVVACNSASAAALHHLRETFVDVPFVGMEPAVKPAAAGTSRGVVGVLATAATFQGELYASVVDRHAGGVEVVEVVAAGLVEAIEDGRTADAGVIVQRHVAMMLDAGVDTIVLGCTHYAFVTDLIAESAGPDVAIVDPSAAVAKQVARVLRRRRLSNHASSGTIDYVTTGDAARFAGQVGLLIGLEAFPVSVAL